jgi:translation initiation factor IF-2
MIVGGRVEEGQITKVSKIGIIREGVEIGKGEIEELQHNKAASKSAHMGEEFGLKLKTPIKIQVGDLLESYERKYESHQRGTSVLCRGALTPGHRTEGAGV